jgi:hypothetical protein
MAVKVGRENGGENLFPARWVADHYAAAEGNVPGSVESSATFHIDRDS